MRKTLMGTLACLWLTTGCSWLGYYKYRAPEKATPEQMAAYEFPQRFDGAVELTGPMMAALKVAMDDFRPPWLKPDDQKYPDDKCLADWRYIHTSVVQASEDLFYVLLIPDLSQCGPGFMHVDAGATYAIDGKGRILARQ